MGGDGLVARVHCIDDQMHGNIKEQHGNEMIRAPGNSTSFAGDQVCNEILKSLPVGDEQIKIGGGKKN